MTTQPESQSHPPIPKEYAGKWIAWNHDETKIIASGRTSQEAWRAAQHAGERDPLLEKVPDAKVRFLGGAA